MELQTAEEQQPEGPLAAYASRSAAGADASLTDLPQKTEQGARDKSKSDVERDLSAGAHKGANAESTTEEHEGPAASTSAQDQMQSGGSGKPGEEGGDERGGHSSLAAAERPTVVRIKRRRTESPLDALSEDASSGL